MIGLTFWATGGAVSDAVGLGNGPSYASLVVEPEHRWRSGLPSPFAPSPQCSSWPP
jgi:hypothetical protein